MDKVRSFIFISVLGGLIYFGFIYDWDQGVINDDYVASESYQQLEEEIAKEQKSAVSNFEKVRSIIQEVINSNSSKKIKLPLDDITFLKNESDWQNFGDFKYLNIGSLDQDLLKMYFVLIQKPGMYDEAGLIMAAAQNDSLIEFKTIGKFKDSVAEKVKTEIYLKGEYAIGTKIITKRLYPVEQENMSTHLFEITESGEIKSIEG